MSGDEATTSDAPTTEELGTNDEADDRDEIPAALAEIRRECLKAAFVYASLDAVVVLLSVDLAVAVVGLPVVGTDIAPGSFASLSLPAPDAGTLVSVVAGAVAFVAEFVVRSRRPAVEQFEAANPEVREALRTARDAARTDRSNPMTRALYADVLDRLRETSSVGLLNGTRLAATVVLALALSLATVQTAVVGLDLASIAGGPESGSPGSDSRTASRAAIPNQSAELTSGDEVLGEPTNVSAGSENLSAAVSASPGGEGERDWNYDSDAGASGGEEVDAQRAGFASPARVEDAALVQRYARELEGNTTDD